MTDQKAASRLVYCQGAGEFFLSQCKPLPWQQVAP